MEEIRWKSAQQKRARWLRLKAIRWRSGNGDGLKGKGRSGSLAEPRALLVCGAFHQVHVDQGLVRHADLLPEVLEVLDGFGVQSDGDGLADLGGVRILGRVREVVFRFHGFLRWYWADSLRVALRLEIIRIVSSSPCFDLSQCTTIRTLNL